MTTKNTVFKRKWFPRFVILVGILFMAFSTASLATSARSLEDWSMLAVEAPIVAVITISQHQTYAILRQLRLHTDPSNPVDPDQILSEMWGGIKGEVE